MTEDDQAGRRTAAGPDMRTAGSVACLALQTAVTEGPAWIVRLRVAGTKDASDGGVVVAAQTGIGARGAVGGAVASGWCGRRGGRRDGRRSGRRGGTGGICRSGRARQQSECSDDAGTR